MQGFGRCIAMLAAVSTVGVSTTALAEQVVEGSVHVVGLQPSQRPDWAPRVTEVVRSSGWYQRALTGIEPPYPASLRFLEDVGNWHQPFIRPGMTGPYDIRGWHSQ